MGGSVWEWCEDWNDESEDGKVLRGVAWNLDDPHKMASADRNSEQ
jgi:formylglycine-generating enzyme required for sulfatase activity